MPRVSCILPTIPPRRQLLERAVLYFLRQTYPSKDLTIVDEDPGNLPSWILARPEIRCIRVTPSHSKGAKLNVGIAETKGDVLLCMDDDDWYHPRWMETLLGTLLRAPAGIEIATMGRFKALVLDEWKMRVSQSNWMLGNSLCFRRSTWEKTRFDESPGHKADSQFLAACGNRPATVLDENLCVVLRRREGHLWTRIEQRSVEEHFLRFFPLHPDPPEAHFSSEDAGFYRLLRAMSDPTTVDPGVPCDPDGYGMAPDSASYLRRICEEEQPRTVVELGTGPGVSLSVLAKWCPASAEIWTVDHFREWIDEATKRLSSIGLTRPVRGIVAPLSDKEWRGRVLGWYDSRVLSTIPSGIDLLLVDGHSRGPALQEFLSRLSPKAVILLDDCRRGPEREVFLSWQQELAIAGKRFTVALIPTARAYGEIRLLP